MAHIYYYFDYVFNFFRFSESESPIAQRMKKYRKKKEEKKLEDEALALINKR